MAHKRYDINTHILIEGNNNELLQVSSIATFVTPTKFSIDYLRVKWEGRIPAKNVLLIDGRKDFVYFREDAIDERYQDKRLYGKFREKPDRIDYDNI